MGQDVSADLSFGVDCGVEESPWIDEEFAEHIEDPGDLIGELCRQAGILSPYDSIPDEINRGSEEAYEQWKNEQPNWDADLVAYREAKKKIEDECPVAIDFYGALEVGSSYVIYIKGTRIGGGWEGTRKIDPAQLAIPDNLDEVAAFCEEHGLKWGEPRWLLYGSLG